MHAVDVLAIDVGMSRACAALEVNRSSVYRRNHLSGKASYQKLSPCSKMPKGLACFISRKLKGLQPQSRPNVQPTEEITFLQTEKLSRARVAKPRWQMATTGDERHEIKARPHHL
ncbi:MAG: hypothetical protein JWP34_1790 [Massilia sp.]|nr:hypothetical protein [Massilia sp.]